MFISEYILLLQEIQKEHGDLPVKRYGPCGVTDPNAPQIKNMGILKGRERIPRYWDTWHDADSKGVIICSI